MSPNGAVTGEVRLQRQLTNGNWSTVRDVQVRRGQATTTVSPSRKTRYRVISRGVESPGNVPRRVSFLYTLDVW